MGLKELEKEAFVSNLGRMALNGLSSMNKGGVAKTVAHYGDKIGAGASKAFNAVKTKGLGTAAVEGASKLGTGVKNTFNSARNKFTQAKMMDQKRF